jgi:hypothetical protein
VNELLQQTNVTTKIDCLKEASTTQAIICKYKLSNKSVLIMSYKYTLQKTKKKNRFLKNKQQMLATELLLGCQHNLHKIHTNRC